MLKMVLEAFQRGVRKDVAIVPIGFTYERLVEESSMTEERRGISKTRETLLQLLRARTAVAFRSKLCGDLELVDEVDFAGRFLGPDDEDLESYRLPLPGAPDEMPAIPIT